MAQREIHTQTHNSRQPVGYKAPPVTLWRFSREEASISSSVISIESPGASHTYPHPQLSEMPRTHRRWAPSSAGDQTLSVPLSERILLSVGEGTSYMDVGGT
ncbi:uncharacterized protein LOC111268637 [Varroa jacobsoni]|uniref:uncharacterized protein LOC111268637 n=1 Tax=Varroa jacobsoni TaxID=62625 RepID=UPI000BF8A5AF|nr:uncharacterized protein LOC111268637 [Varroa jacobsoni]